MLLETFCYAIISHPYIRALYESLQGFEMVKAVHLEPKPWTPEDILTSTFKLKRADAKKWYQKEVCPVSCHYTSSFLMSHNL